MDMIWLPLVSVMDISTVAVNDLFSPNNFVITASMPDMPGVCARHAPAKSNEAAVTTKGLKKDDVFIDFGNLTIRRELASLIFWRNPFSIVVERPWFNVV